MTQEHKYILQDLLQQHRKLGIIDQIDYDKFYLYSIITHSTAIEGSTVTEVEAKLLFDEGITSSKRTIVEQNMNLDLKNAYDYGRVWIKKHEDITIDWLVLLASKVMSRTGSEYHSAGGDFSAARGELRKLNVTAGFEGKSYMSYLKVPVKLQAFCNELNKRRKEIDVNDVASIYDLSFWAHFELVTIHPWADGNGRTSRLLMNLIQMEYDVLPTKVLKEDKAEYIQSLIDAREAEDVNIFIDFMTSLHCKHLKTDIDQFTSSVAGEMVDKWSVDDTIKSLQFTERQRKIYDAIKNGKVNDTINDTINAQVLSNSLGVSVITIKRDLYFLRDMNLIKYVGSNKTGHWEVI
ncbi:MAG: Fic family protein [Paludibacteraceae bacterium]|nr:Fic family protein [Paludibacteraceae bacterium]